MRANAGSRKQALTLLADKLAEEHGLDAAVIVDAAMERERLGSTGVGEGVAIPHARIAGLSQPVGAFARLDRGVDFEAVDDRECDLVFLLLAPRSNGADHLRALAQVARAFRRDSIREQIRRARTADDIHNALCPQAKGEAA